MGCIRFLLSPFASVLGAIVLGLVTLIGFAITTSTLGMQKAYLEDGWLVSDTFAAILLGITFVGSMAGAFVARRMGSGLATLLLIAFVAYISLVQNVDSPQDPSKSQRFAGRPDSRPENVGLVDLMRWTEQPNWVRYGSALVGVTGVLFGASLAKSRRKTSGADAD
ncbi:MAG: hypothetical protein RIS45_541 [Planctomycetota bacterium]